MCNLCSGIVQFVIRHDRKKKFLFASFQGKAGKAIAEKWKVPLPDADSFVLVLGDSLYSRSDAALLLLRKLGGGWSLLYGLKILPRFIRDGVYRYIARNRYKWFGKKESCLLPSPETRDRFLD